jgi:hypothetical protein
MKVVRANSYSFKFLLSSWFVRKPRRSNEQRSVERVGRPRRPLQNKKSKVQVELVSLVFVAVVVFSRTHGMLFHVLSAITRPQLVLLIRLVEH